MDEIGATIDEIPATDSLKEYRLNSNPFFLKLCPNTNLDLDNKALFPGMYLPLDYWKRLVKDDSILGEKGGRIVGFENAGRRLNNTEFISLVASGFVGSKIYQSHFIAELMKKVFAEGKSVTLAFHTINNIVKPTSIDEQDVLLEF
jgi:hypothetical protein